MAGKLALLECTAFRLSNAFTAARKSSTIMSEIASRLLSALSPSTHTQRQLQDVFADLPLQLPTWLDGPLHLRPELLPLWGLPHGMVPDRALRIPLGSL